MLYPEFECFDLISECSDVSHRGDVFRLLGFGGMAVILWTPVLVPLLPTLLQQWATKSPSGVADAAAGIGLYGAIFILVTIWGRRVRGYDRPLVSYGLHLFSRAKVNPSSPSFPKAILFNS